MILLLVIILCVFLLMIALLVIGVVIALSVTRKEKKEHIRVTAEAVKIDAMAADSRITAEEARELKQALGPAAFTLTSLEPDIHIKVIGILNIIFCCLGVLVFGGILCHFSVSLATVESGTIPWIAITSLPVFFLLVFILRIVASLSLMRGTPWARIVIIIFAIPGILNFPLGTTLSIYTLWALLLREDAGLYFISNNMKAHKVAAIILFLTGLPLWVGLMYLTYFLPVKVHYWENSATELPTITQLVVNTGIVCQRFGIILYPLLCLLTLGAVLWFVIASIKDKNPK